MGKKREKAGLLTSQSDDVRQSCLRRTAVLFFAVLGLSRSTMLGSIKIYVRSKCTKKPPKATLRGFFEAI
jgi:hypothetical protein